MTKFSAVPAYNPTLKTSETVELFVTNQITEKTQQRLEGSVKSISAHQHLNQAAQTDETDKAISTVTTEDYAISPLEQAMSDALDKVSSRDVAFNRDDLLKHALSLGLGEVSVPSVLSHIESLENKGELVTVHVRGEAKSMRIEDYRVEKNILSIVNNQQNSVAPFIEANPPEAALKGLTKGQQESVQTILNTQDGFVAIQGFAGTGKTHMLKATQQIMQAHQPNIELRGLAPTHAAVNELTQTGLQSQTVSQFIADQMQLLEKGNTPNLKNMLFFVDEGSMIGNQEMIKMVSLIDKFGGRAVLQGDYSQLQPVSQGKPFELMQEKQSIQTALMKDIIRQRDPEIKKAVFECIAGRVNNAFETIEKLSPQNIKRDIDDPKSEQFSTQSSCVNEEKVDILQKIADDYTSREKNVRDNTLVIAHTNANKSAANELIHNNLVEKGEIGKENIKTKILVPVKMDPVDFKDISNYTPSDTIRHFNTMKVIQSVDIESNTVTLRNDNTSKNEIWSLDKITPNGMALYSHQEITLSTGDKVVQIRTQSNLGRKSKEHFLVKSIDDSGNITLENQSKNITINPSKYLDDRMVNYNYAVNGYDAQGQSFDYGISLETATGNAKKLATERSAYIAISRVKNGITIYSDDLEGYFKAMGKNEKSSLSAHDLAELKKSFNDTQGASEILKEIESLEKTLLTKDTKENIEKTNTIEVTDNDIKQTAKQLEKERERFDSVEININPQTLSRSDNDEVNRDAELSR